MWWCGSGWRVCGLMTSGWPLAWSVCSKPQAAPGSLTSHHNNVGFSLFSLQAEFSGGVLVCNKCVAVRKVSSAVVWTMCDSYILFHVLRSN